MIKTVNELQRADFSNWVINGNADKVLRGVVRAGATGAWASV